jgi:hypothetical protein
MINQENPRFSVDVLHIQKIRETNEYVEKVTTAYSVCAVITGTGYAIKPLLSYIVFKLILEQPYVREVPIPSEFFFDVTASPAYELTYFMMIGAIYLRVCLCVSQLESIKTVLDQTP